MKLPKKFKLPFSQGTPWVETFLKKKAGKLPKSEALTISKKTYKEILKRAEEIKNNDIPPHLTLSYVHPDVKTGVFLKKGEKAIQTGELIGIYTGTYELVKSDVVYSTAYAYDVAQDIRLTQKDLPHVLLPVDYKQTLSTKEEYSIQTNALDFGNFTRFINHSSLEPNIEAIVCKLPEERIEIVLFALKKIKPGEQLLSNYGGQYWRALKVIPNDIRPTTYMLNQKGKATLHKKEPRLFPRQKKYLLPLTEPFPYSPEELDALPFIKKLKKKLPVVTKKHKAQIDAFEEIVSERGLPRSLTLRFKKNKPVISVPKQGTMIHDGDFIGIATGLFSLTPKKDTSWLCLYKEKEHALFLETSSASNFLSNLPNSSKANVAITLYYDKDTDSIYPFVFAIKDILPGHSLILKQEGSK